MKILFLSFKIFFPLLLFFPYTLAFSQNILWQKTYGGTGEDLCVELSKTMDGGFILIGRTYRTSYDIYLVKTDSNGDSLWTRIIDLGSHEYPSDGVQTADGGYIITGEFGNQSNGTYDIGLLKTDANGNPQWMKMYGDSIGCCDAGAGVIQTSDGGYIMVGTINNAAVYPDSNNIVLIKTFSDGTPQWQKIYGGTKHDRTLYHSLSNTQDGGYIIAGETQSFADSTYTDLYLIRTNSNGDTLWTKTFGVDSLYEWSYSVHETNDGGFITTGVSGRPPSIPEDMYVVKTDSDGNMLWIKKYGGQNVEYSYDGVECYSGYAIAGWSDSFGSTDGYVIRTDVNGDTLWTQLIGGSSLDGFGSIEHLSDGSLVVSGNTYSFGNGNADFYIVKLSDSLTSISNVENELIKINIFPNPFHTESLVELEHHTRNFNLRLIIYDLFGKEVKQFTLKEKLSIINRSNLSNGMYFYSIVSTNQIILTGKLIII